MKVYIGYEHYDDKKTLHNGFYHQFKDDFDIEEVDIYKHNNYYIFPINALYASTDVLEKYSFFGNSLSEKVLSDLQSNRCLLHINWITEAYRFNKDHMNRLYNFLFKNNISPKNILISSDNFQLKRDFREWNTNDEINILELAVAEKGVECDNNYVGFKRVAVDDAFNDEVRHSHILSVGRTPHNHRISLVDFYEREGFGDDKILWSALWKNKRISEKYHWPSKIDEDGINHGSSDLDISQYNQNPYFHSYVEVVTETIYDGSAIQISDKPFKPSLNLLPFIYVSSAGSLEVLKSFGYKTFDSFIDESYDKIEDNKKRMDKIQSEIKRLCNMDRNELHTIYYSMRDLLIYNRNHFLECGQDRVREDFINFLEKWRLLSG